MEEVVAADIVLHVRDCADPDTEAQRQDVETILKNLLREREAGDEDDDRKMPARIEILNKTDLLAPDEQAALGARADRTADLISVSALDGSGCDTLLDMIDAKLAETDTVADVEVALSDGATMAWLYEKGDVLDRNDDGMKSRLKVRLAPRDMARFRKQQAAEENVG